MKYFLSLTLILLSSGCVTSLKLNSEFDPDKAYIAAYLLDDYKITLLDLNTNKEVRLKMNEKPGELTIVEVPPGEYTIVRLTHIGMFLIGETIFSQKGSTIDLYVPIHLKTIINIEKNSVTFLGNLDTNFKHTLTEMHYSLNSNYTWKEATKAISANYYYGNEFKIKPLDRLSIKNKTESLFKFNK